ncbi:hypothetical protein EDD53_0359 [Pacificibacter maritimus]|uniref:Uncharacterized protein n=1 Tax=Pacificibacter maritimus TaxID=762213 RepID=A0A3N4VE79_9RHOB|nr:hypothetical protein [Pacificibacter maritimus]RPE71244.1 hypothetical protein EDD53_0359 [Pacificibacter maritimus]
MFSKTYHPMDSRHPNNRAKSREMKSRRLSETRSAQYKAVQGGVLNTQSANDIRAMLQDVESAPIVDLHAQKTLKKRLAEPARVQGEKEFWARQPWWLRHGPLSVFMKFGALRAGEQAKGTPVWMQVLALPVAVLLYIALSNSNLDSADINLATANFVNFLVQIVKSVFGLI